MKMADKMFEKLGFTKGEEKEFVVTYSRKYKEPNYRKVIEICQKENETDGSHCIVFTNVGITPAEMKACLQKIEEKRWL